jgi:hypothetical protein
MPGYGSYRTGVNDGTDPSPKKVPGAVNGGNKCSFVERFDLSQANVLKNIGQNNLVAEIPEGHAPLSIKVSSSVSLTTAQLSFGTPAAPAFFGALKAYGTTAEAIVEYLPVARRGVLLTTEPITELLMTIAAANLPTTGTIVVEVETAAVG